MNERIEVRKRMRRGNGHKRKICNQVLLRHVGSPAKAVLSEPQMVYERLPKEGSVRVTFGKPW